MKQKFNRHLIELCTEITEMIRMKKYYYSEIISAINTYQGITFGVVS